MFQKRDPHLLGALLLPESLGLVGMLRAGGYQGHPPSWEGGWAMERASGLGFRLFFSFLPKQPSCVFWRPVNHSSSSGKRGEEYMIQPSKNAGRLGARVEEARNQPRAGSSSRPSRRARPSVPGQQPAPQPRAVQPGRAGHAAARWGARQRGEPRLSATVVKLHFSSRSGCFQDFKTFHICSAEGKKKTERTEKRGWSALGKQRWAGRQDLSHWDHRSS